MSELGGYRVVRRLKAVGVRQLAAAEHAQHKGKLELSQCIARDPAEQSAFLESARLQEQLAQHSSLWVNVLEVGTFDGMPACVSRLPPRTGRWLLDYVVRLNGRKLYHIARGILQALDVLYNEHSRGHGALSPDAVVLGKGNSFKRVQLRFPQGTSELAKDTLAADLKFVGEMLVRLANPKTKEQELATALDEMAGLRAIKGAAWKAWCQSLLEGQVQTPAEAIKALTPLRPTSRAWALALVPVILGAAYCGYLAIPMNAPKATDEQWRIYVTEYNVWFLEMCQAARTESHPMLAWLGETYPETLKLDRNARDLQLDPLVLAALHETSAARETLLERQVKVSEDSLKPGFDAIAAVRQRIRQSKADLESWAEGAAALGARNLAARLRRSAATLGREPPDVKAVLEATRGMPLQSRPDLLSLVERGLASVNKLPGKGSPVSRSLERIAREELERTQDVSSLLQKCSALVKLCLETVEFHKEWVDLDTELVVEAGLDQVVSEFTIESARQRMVNLRECSRPTEADPRPDTETQIAAARERFEVVRSVISEADQTLLAGLLRQVESEASEITVEKKRWSKKNVDVVQAAVAKITTSLERFGSEMQRSQQDAQAAWGQWVVEARQLTAPEPFSTVFVTSRERLLGGAIEPARRSAVRAELLAIREGLVKVAAEFPTAPDGAAQWPAAWAMQGWGAGDPKQWVMQLFTRYRTKCMLACVNESGQVDLSAMAQQTATFQKQCADVVSCLATLATAQKQVDESGLTDYAPTAGKSAAALLAELTSATEIPELSAQQLSRSLTARAEALDGIRNSPRPQAIATARVSYQADGNASWLLAAAHSRPERLKFAEFAGEEETWFVASVAKLASAVPLERSLRESWLAYFRLAASDEEVAQCIARMTAYGVQEAAITEPALVFNYQLYQVRAASKEFLAMNPDDAAIRSRAQGQYELLNGLASRLEAKPVVGALLSASQSPAGTSPEQLGPGSAAAGGKWSGKADGREVVTFVRKVGAEEFALNFVRVPGRPGEKAFYICTTEMPVGVVLEVLNEASKKPGAAEVAKLIAAMPEDLDELTGPRVWQYDRNRFRVATSWVKSDLATVSSGRPTGQHPMQMIPAPVAQYVAEQMGCRLPRQDEYERLIAGYRDRRLAEFRVRREGWKLPHDMATIPDKLYDVGDDAARALPREEQQPTWPEPVSPDGDAREITHLVGNVAEWATPRAQAGDGSGVTVQAVICGGSMYSDPGTSDHTALLSSVGVAAVTMGSDMSFSDVGFRLCFDEDRESMASQYQRAVDGLKYVTPE